ncbi:MAG: hypothetical protein PHO10_08575 [Gemmiger sp.]|nr:hypothetical protein [Gemmiger sp.]
MAMDLNAKAAYIRGLMSGMEFDENSKNGKVITAMMDLLEEMASTVSEHDDALDQVYEELDTLDEDMDDLMADLYDISGEDEDEDDEYEDGEATYEVTCPNCNTVTTVDEDSLMNKELVCPNCGAAFDIEFENCDGNCAGCTAEELDTLDKE